MSDAEIKAVVDTARALGSKVAARAHGEQAINHAAGLRVDSIEHGTFEDTDSYKIMKARGAYLAPTLLIAGAVYKVAKANPALLSPTVAEKAIAVAPTTVRNLGAAYRAGVKIAFGADESLVPYGQNAKEFALMVGAGMTPMDAIRAATVNAADLLGGERECRLHPGRSLCRSYRRLRGSAVGHH
jgi:imidazolonepropionase-like amidohydrolase